MLPVSAHLPLSSAALGLVWDLTFSVPLWALPVSTQGPMCVPGPQSLPQPRTLSLDPTGSLNLSPP